MPITIVATPGDASANSYLTVAQADQDAELLLRNGDWRNQDDDDKARALIEATRMIDRVPMAGYPAYANQRLQFPRAQQSEARDTIPEDIKQACLVQAIELLRTGTAEGTRAAMQAEGVVSFATGSHSETFGPRRLGADSGLSHRALAYLNGWIARSGRLIGPRDTARGANTKGWGPWQ